MVTQYPHKLVITTIANSSQDADGNWQQGEATVKEYVCRDEPANGNGFITAVDGSRIEFSSIVYLPLPVDEIEIGAKAEVFDASGHLRIASTVKRFSNAQLNARIWL